MPTNHIQKQQRDHTAARVRRSKERADRRKAQRIDRAHQPKKQSETKKDAYSLSQRRQAKIVKEAARARAREERLILRNQQEADALALQELQRQERLNRERQEAEELLALQKEETRQEIIRQLVEKLSLLKPGLTVAYQPGAEIVTVVDPSFSKKTPAWKKLEERVAAVGGEFENSYPQIGVEVRLTLSK